MWFIVILYGAPMSYCCNTACYSQMLWWRYKSLTTDPFAAADTFYWKWIYEARTVICSWIMDQNGTEYSPFSHFQSPAAKKSKVWISQIVFNQKKKWRAMRDLLKEICCWRLQICLLIIIAMFTIFWLSMKYTFWGENLTTFQVASKIFPPAG